MSSTAPKIVNRPLTAAPQAPQRQAAPAASSTLRSPWVARFSDHIGTRDAAPPPDADGKRLFRTSGGEWVELPSDVTAEEAAQLETEAKAAQQKLGKGPGPQPVPDAKKLAKKEPTKPATKVEARRGKGGARGGTARRAGSAAAALLGKVGSGKVAQYLAAKGGPVLARGLGRLQRLKQNEQTHDDAGQKRQQSEMAVLIPPSEGQSISSAGHVDAVGGRATPAVEEKKAKDSLSATLQENIPRTLEDVDNFQRDQKAQHMGADVMKVVQGDKNAVTGTFGDIEAAPPPAPREHEPQALPPEEMAPATAGMALGSQAIAPLQKEHTDLSNFTKDADNKLKEEGVTQEQLDMVDSGDLAMANQEKKGMEKTAVTEPLAINKFAQQRAATVEKDLQQEESKERNTLRARRKAALSATGQKQRGTRTALEKKRDEVAAKINGMYTSARDSVKKKLAALETTSMKRFDDGNARATKTFEDTVKSEFEAFKADRYSGWFGWARRAKDWLLGMEDLPRVKAIFDTNRRIFVDAVNRLVADITADNQRVIRECKQEIEDAKTKIKEFVATLKPGLADIGKQAAEDMNSKLDALDQTVADKEKELGDKLRDKQQAAIRAIDEKIEKMKEAMSGALAKLGKLLLWAAKKFFTWALEKFGFSLGDIESIINKGAAVLKAIFTGPIQFVKRLISAASIGFKNFGKNFLTHLKNAVFEWLTGSLEGLILPETWDLKGILSVVFQMVGITYQNIRAHLLKLVPEPVVKSMETGFALVKTLITEGPMAAWEQLKEIAGELKDAFVEGVKNWIKWKVVEEAIKTVLALFVPGAGIIRAIIGIYDTVVFFIQKAKQIMQMIGSFLGSIAEIAAGNIGAAAQALEDGLARGLKLVIEFLARFLRLSGITQKIRDVIHGVRDKVDNVIAKVAKWIVGKGSKFVGAAKAGAKKLWDWWKEKIPFRSSDGTEHSISVESESPTEGILVRSTPTYLGVLIGKITKEDQKKTAQAIQRKIAEIIKSGRQDKDEAAVKARAADLGAKLLELSKVLVQAKVLDKVPAAPAYDFKPEGDRAKKATVKNLSSMRQWGSTPGSAKPVGWEYAQAIGLTTSGPMLRRLHLINERFGGPGMNSNLAVASKTDNENHLYEVENKIKELVGDKPNERDKLTVVNEYTVTVEYGRPNTVLRYKKLTARLNDFPTKFSCKWEYMEGDSLTKRSKDIHFKTPDSDFEN